MARKPSTRAILLKQLASESLIYGLSGVVASFLNLLLLPFFTRAFSPEDYGVIGLVTTTVTLLTIFVALGMDSAAGRWYWDTEEIPERKKTIASWIWLQLGISTALALALFSLGDLASMTLLGRKDAGVYFRLGALTLPLGVLSGVAVGWMRLERRPFATVAFSLVTSLVNVFAALTLVFHFHTGISGIFWAQILAFLLGSVVAAFLMRDWANPGWFHWSRTSEMLAYALPLIPGSLAFWVVNLSGRYFVQGYSTTAEVGLFQVGSGIATAVALVTGAFQQAWGPFALSIHKQPDSRQVYADTFLLYLWGTCFLSVILSLFSREILGIFTTKAYLGADRVICILSFNYVLIGLNYIAVLGSTIMKSIKPYGFAILVSGCFAILLNFLLVPRYGKEGAALATLLSQLFVPVYVFYRSQRDFPIPYRFGAGAFIFLFGIASCTVYQRIPEAGGYWAMALKGITLAVFAFLPFLLGLVRRPSWGRKEHA